MIEIFFKTYFKFIAPNCIINAFFPAVSLAGNSNSGKCNARSIRRDSISSTNYFREIRPLFKQGYDFLPLLFLQQKV